MNPIFVFVLVGFLILDVLIFGGLWFLAAYSKANRPKEVNRGDIADITGKPNCVSSRSTDPARRVDPISYSGDDEEAWTALVSIIREMPKSKIVTDEAPYLYAEMQSQLFGFVDDLEIKQDREARVFHVRSASRVGHSDLGANRKRVEQLRRMYSDF